MGTFNVSSSDIHQEHLQSHSNLKHSVSMPHRRIDVDSTQTQSSIKEVGSTELSMA